MAPTLDEVVAALEAIAPLGLAAPWDNVGLLLRPTRPRAVERALLTIDLSPWVCEEALALDVQLVVAYHPPLFQPVTRLLGSPPGPTRTHAQALVELIERRVAVYAPHTALDAAPGGVNDWLAEAFGEARERAAIEPAELPADGAAGAEQSAAPCGQGRRVVLAEPLSLEAVVERVKEHLGLARVRVAASPAHAAGAPIDSVAVCAGAGGSVLSKARAACYLTGEMRHHDVLAANERGTSVLLTDHTNSERGYLPRFAARLGAALGSAPHWLLARTDREPLAFA